MDVANLARLDQLADLDAEGEVARPHSLHQEQVLLLGLGDELLGLRGSDGEGFLAQHVLASLEGEHGVLEVVAVGSSNVDNVDVGVRDELSIGAVRLGRGRTVDVLDKIGGALG